MKNLSKRLNISDQVEFFGQMSHDRIFKWLESIDVYIQPSLQEGMPRSVIEAMSMAVPVVGSNVGGIPELIPNHMIFKARRVSEIASLLAGMDAPLLKQEAYRNFIIAKEFEPEVLNKKRLAFYQEFINSVREKTHKISKNID